jgi:hypothetical protein
MHLGQVSRKNTDLHNNKILHYERSVSVTYPFILKGWLKLGRTGRPEHVAHKGKQETDKNFVDGRPE